MIKFLEYAVGQYMTHPVKTVTRQTSLRELEALFAKHDFNAFPVMEGTTMVGLVTKFDFLKVFAFTTRQMTPQYDEIMQRAVAEVMTEAVVHVTPADPLTRTLQLMINLKARSFPVVAPDGHLVGMIAREDIMRALRDATRAR
ncbi:MAG: CBS domain-containing protein [Deltaproteobacteria bacterium]|nr:CBS domain-containing protein [Deltaproteobacteria bacterium]